MKGYIVGQITGEPWYKDIFAVAERYIMNYEAPLHEFAVLNPAKLPETGMEPKDYMQICAAMINVADIVYLLPNWEYSDGATAERAYAICTHKPVMSLPPITTMMKKMGEL